jgi:hypothetical protein
MFNFPAGPASYITYRDRAATCQQQYESLNTHTGSLNRWDSDTALSYTVADVLSM